MAYDKKAAVDKEFREGVARADSLANWSFLGVLVPLVGWVLAAMSKSQLKSMPEADTEKEFEVVRRVNGKIIASVVLSIAVLFISYGVFAYTSYTAYRHEESVRAQEEENRQKLAAEANQRAMKQQALQSCLDRVNEQTNRDLGLNAAYTTKGELGETVYWMADSIRSQIDQRAESSRQACYALDFAPTENTLSGQNKIDSWNKLPDRN